MLNFAELNLKKEILKAIEDMGFEETTPIQEQAIPIALRGVDVIGQAQTGTGKTAAFTIPFLQIIEDNPVIQVLILTPTRELCMQIEKEIKKLSKYSPLKSVAVYGGQDISRQIRELKGKPQVVVATPGRLMDHMNRKTIRLENLKMIILDEADEMLNMGFLEDIETILAACPEQRQTMMFSATMRNEIKQIANKFMHDPEIVQVKAKELTVENIDQYYYEVPESEKFKLLCRLLDMYHPELAMIFGRTKRRVDEVTQALQKMGYQAEGLHGDLTQRSRDMVMNKFRNKRIQILVATDVAARGLDVSGVSHVFNFDLPQEIDSYVHRIGRTGRAGKTGIAFTFVEPREFVHLKNIEGTIKKKLVKGKLPSAHDTRVEKQSQLQAQIVEAIKNEKVYDYQELANDLLMEYDHIDAMAAVLELLAGDSNRETELGNVKLTAERPLRVKALFDHRRGNGRSGSGQRNYRGAGRGENRSGEKERRNYYEKKENHYSKKEGMKDYGNPKKAAAVKGEKGKPRSYNRSGKKTYNKKPQAAE